MALRKLTLSHNDNKDRWELTVDKTNKSLKAFSTKEEALRGGVLKKILGNDGGSVKIKKVNDKFQEERTYPRKFDPISSKG